MSRDRDIIDEWIFEAVIPRMKRWIREDIERERRRRQRRGLKERIKAIFGW